MRILLIEDDISTKKNLELMLVREGFNVYSTELGEDGIGLGKYYNYDLIILDLKLPDMHGYEVLQKMRNFRINTPVLILSGTLGAENKARGLMCGADDYITKPFEKVELIARIHTIIRRSHGYSNSVIETGKLRVNLMTKVVEVEGVPLHLTKKEYAILELLSLRKGTLITKEMFLNHLYGGLHEPGPKIIDVVICKLRKKIAKATGGEKVIQTDWGRGYILRDPQ